MNIFVVYCHPGKISFTHSVKDSFIKGLTDADHNVVISDLYDMQFNPVFSENEYNREAFYNKKIARTVKNHSSEIRKVIEIG